MELHIEEFLRSNYFVHFLVGLLTPGGLDHETGDTSSVGQVLQLQQLVTENILNFITET